MATKEDQSQVAHVVRTWSEVRGPRSGRGQGARSYHSYGGTAVMTCSVTQTRATVLVKQERGEMVKCRYH